MTRSKKSNEQQLRLPDTTERSISFKSGPDLDWGIDIGKTTPSWGESDKGGGAETDTGIVKAFIRQTSLSGTVYSHVIYIPANSKLWRKLSKKRKKGEVGHKAIITVVK